MKPLLVLACLVTEAGAFASRGAPSARAPPLRSAADRGYATPIDIDEGAARDVDAFEAWAQEYGVQRAPGLELAYRSNDAAYGGDTVGWDVSVATNQDAPAGTCVLCVPEAVILTSAKAMAELRTHAMDQAEKIVSSINADTELRQYYLMVKLLVEYEKGEASPWFPWLNS